MARVANRQAGNLSILASTLKPELRHLPADRPQPYVPSGPFRPPAGEPEANLYVDTLRDYQTGLYGLSLRLFVVAEQRRMKFLPTLL